ncbi:TPA: hypothetical protein RD599_000641 [Enterococcus faecium]|uniref:hypothetical protein n=1 Tax=Enterococcus faecium TaxID=1352 RepID=UPI000BDF387C|nr:hypothetical protein [Enterococcus faecium]DAH94208.1 MAG TPA: Head Tail Connector Protein [Caudoviricetes sp.]MCC9080211.1 hypothetical protein [Enterococcus faecium]PCT04624.1 hypothetical protein BTA09_13090 [Enterococcus faecium]BDP64761.1 hypothetical protein EfmJHP80_22570 [Enterococcus faecium]HAQ5326253.1 hypothetical protein [Enterococcus faecium]
MPYIEFEEFKNLTGKTDDFKAIFEKHLLKASAVLDSITNYFYQFNKIEEDPIGFRVKQFKLALCSQIIYFDEVGADTYESINKTPQSFSAGRTSISNKSSEDGRKKSLVAEDVYIYLEGTGLLYRGVPSW